MPYQTPLPRRLRRPLPALAALAVLLAISPVRAAPPLAARDSIVVVVSARSPVRQITRLHLADLYLGRTARFADGTAATPIDRKAGSADRLAFLSTFLGRSEAQIKSHWSKLIFTGRGRPPFEAASPQAMKDRVAGDPRAIGYLDSGLVDGTVRVLRVE